MDVKFHLAEMNHFFSKKREKYDCVVPAKLYDILYVECAPGNVGQPCQHVHPSGQRAFVARNWGCSAQSLECGQHFVPVRIFI